MKGRFDDFIEDMASEIKPAVSSNELNLTNIGKKMEEELKKAFEANAKKPEEVKPTEVKTEPTPEPDGADAVDGSDDINEGKEN